MRSHPVDPSAPRLPEVKAPVHSIRYPIRHPLSTLGGGGVEARIASVSGVEHSTGGVAPRYTYDPDERFRFDESVKVSNKAGPAGQVVCAVTSQDLAWSTLALPP
jgi:hypothetical protein